MAPEQEARLIEQCRNDPAAFGEVFDQWYKPVAYSITKSGILNFTRYLATYWAKKKIRVNTISPAGIFNNQHPEFLAEYTKRIPIGRMAEPNEIAAAVLFLASDEAPEPAVLLGRQPQTERVGVTLLAPVGRRRSTGWPRRTSTGSPPSAPPRCEENTPPS